MQEKIYTPRILLCGDKANFLEQIGLHPFKIVGEIKFSGEHEGKNFNFVEDGKFLLDGNFHEHTELTNILGGLTI